MPAILEIELRCMNCGGAGHVLCPDCNGTAMRGPEQGCSSCDLGTLPCKFCNNTGTLVLEQGDGLTVTQEYLDSLLINPGIKLGTVLYVWKINQGKSVSLRVLVTGRALPDIPVGDLLAGLRVKFLEWVYGSENDLYLGEIEI